MTNMSIAAKVIGAVLALAPVAGATDPRLLEVIMPDARIVFGMDFAHVRTSPMGELFSMGLKSGLQQAKSGPELQNIFGQMGFNPFEDIQELVVASTGGGKNPPTIVAVKGSGKLRALLESQAVRSRAGSDYAVFGDMFVAGDALQVRAAKARRGHGGKINAAMARRIAEMSGKYDLWLISNIPAASLAGDAKTPAMGNMEMLKSIEQFSAGMELSKDFALNLEAVTRDGPSAQSLSGSLQMLLAMAQQGVAGKDPSAADALKRLQFGVDGRVLRIGIRVPAEEMKKQIEAVRAQGGGFAAGRTAVPAPSRAPAPSAPANTEITIQSSPKDMGTIVISGSQK